MAQSNWEADKMYVHSEFCFSGFQFIFAMLNLLNLCFFFGWVSFSCGRLDVYIHDYLLKRKLHASAKAFMTEGKVATDPVGKCCKLNSFPIHFFGFTLHLHYCI